MDSVEFLDVDFLVLNGLLYIYTERTSSFVEDKVDKTAVVLGYLVYV